CKGANWVPCEPFPSAESNEKITIILTLAKNAGFNMIRVWGGGIFEKEHFYNECDRLGIMVTQDFLMACGHYPDEKPQFITQLKKETEFAALALRNHPCLMWWSGDNENAVSGHDEAETYQGRGAIFEGIFPVLNKLDPKRRFLLSSPFGGNFYSSKTKGTTHNTNYLGSIMPFIMGEDVSDYKEFFQLFLARFIAEEPTFGAMCLPSLRRFMTDKDIFENDEMWYYHTKDNPFLDFTLFDMVKSFAANLLGKFKNGNDRFFKLKYVQYEWVRILMENVRRNKGFINGQIFWMLNDCWPAACGWSFIDYYGLPKAAYYAFKRCASPVVISVDKKDFYRVFLSNDTYKDIPVNLKIFVLNNSKICLISDINVIAAANKSGVVATLDGDVLQDGDILLCQITGDGITDRTFYKNGALPIKENSSTLIVDKSENSVTITATAYVHTVELEGEFVFEDNYFTLYPGETRTIKFEPILNAKTKDISVVGYTL
ncbi:MAG: hypothetical protein II342_02985, partial [Clostridia bacterium]|nr:hypothetical protein [Clostridia bacterium]